ncbi:MAG: cation:proton antiporter [Acidobacteriota bacterium]
MTNVFLVGLILLLALVGGHLMKWLRVPEIVGYLLVGLLLGPSFSEILTGDAIHALEIFSEIALGLILFSLGAVFEMKELRAAGRQTVLLTLYLMLGTFLCVLVALLLLQVSWQVALLLGVVAIEVSPIATILVLRELNSEGPLTDAINHILAINNVGCIITFGIATFLVRLVERNSVDAGGLALGVEVFYLAWQLLGSIAIGILLGHLLALWGRRVQEHGEVLILVLGMILVLVGACHWLDLSALIATMALGATLINIEKESRHLFDVLGRTDPPLYAIFFVLAGADLSISSLKTIGFAGVGYTAARAAGKFVGAYWGARALRLPPIIGKYVGLTLIAHAGVAIGLVLQIRSMFPRLAEVISTVILASVLINEIAGPILTRQAVIRAGEARIARLRAFEEL